VRLTQIKLAGFKSFVDPTIIPIPSQLVGVVGPNGCGKSNIIDAVRWVLGETRAGELRGESMQDVIFNGSGERKPAARASVELAFDNSAGRVQGQWNTYAEIAVRRVLTRDGASAYFINNQQVRRRDIHDIFLGTGLGSRGYAIIGQGMISRLIEARPEELRVYLEEAAGVSRYKERRRETENRLADTRENLTRVQDILRELNDQVERLQAQAHIAQTYRDLQSEGECKQHVLWLLRENEGKAQQRVKTEAIEKAEHDMQATLTQLRRCEAELESRRQAHLAATDAVHAAQGQLYQAGAQVSRLEAEIRHVVDARARVQTRQTQLQQQQQEWTDQEAHCAQQIALAQDELETACAGTEVARDRVEAVRERLPQMQARVHEAALARDALRRALAQVEQELALTAQAQRDTDRQLQALEQRQARLQQEKQDLAAPDPVELERLAADKAQAEAQHREAQAQLVALEERLPGLDAARGQTQAQAQQQAQALAHLQARHTALERLQQDVQQQGALTPWLERHELASLARLWQKLHVEPGWETALESILRERLAALALRHLEHARAFASDAPPARLVLCQLPTATSAPTVAPGLEPLTGLLRLNDPDLRTLLNDWLRDVYIAQDMAHALAARAQLPPGGVFVLQDGHQVDRHSVHFYAADSEQSGMLARQQEIENLRLEIKAGQLLADQAVTAAARADQAWRQASQAMVPARARVGELTQYVHDSQLRMTRLQHLAEQMDARSTHLQQALDELAAQQEILSARREEAQTRFETLDAALAEQQMRFADAELADEGLAREAEALQQQLRDYEHRVQESEFAERSLKTRIAELERNAALAHEQVQRATRELESLQGELFDLDASAAQAGLQEALALRTAHEERLQQARIQADNLAALLREADEARLQLERGLEPARAQITQLQLQEQAARLAVEQYAAQLEAQQIDRAALQTFLQQQDATYWQRPAWLQSEVQRITRQINALGAVNLAALDELRSAQERKGFLDAQCQDLNQAIDTLENAIRTIDQETRALLQDTFDTANRAFGELFPRLFGGGQARLVMTGDEILDAGVQVMAQPPGKRNSTIHLLSGGEKALTATALVFALFTLNPAPFCLLDEVDAPLDDANTERYANLVRGMSDQTQFLFISHNKIAMQVAQQLIGVTMQEQGVSRIVAVDMDAALRWAET